MIHILKIEQAFRKGRELVAYSKYMEHSSHRFQDRHYVINTDVNQWFDVWWITDGDDRDLFWSASELKWVSKDQATEFSIEELEQYTLPEGGVLVGKPTP